MGFRGAIFDVDGVLVDSPHERAWRDALRQLMDTDWRDIRDQTTYSPERFTSKVYQEVMAGKLRLGGATAALAYFKVPDAANRAEAYGERKQQRVVELIEAGEFHAFPDALRFALAVKFTGLKLAAASSSKNADEFLKRIPLDVFTAERGLPYDFIHEAMTLLNLFDADIAGRDFEHGKPHLMIFLTAPQELGFPPEHCFVVEDASCGCRQARCRAGSGEAGTDLMVTSLDDVAVNALSQGRLDRATIRLWAGGQGLRRKRLTKVGEQLWQGRSATYRTRSARARRWLGASPASSRPCSSTTTEP